MMSKLTIQIPLKKCVKSYLQQTPYPTSYFTPYFNLYPETVQCIV
jgi:hypothetical protein